MFRTFARSVRPFSTSSILLNKAPIPTAQHPILKRVPKFLQPFTTRFINAPILHVTSFLVLHELTAIAPLIGLWYVFHQHPDFIPNIDFTHYGIDKITSSLDKAMAQFDFSNFSINEKARFLMEGAYAYVVVKVFAPVRIFISLGLMPSFSKFVVVPFNNGIKKLAARFKKRKPEEQKIKKVDKPRL